MLEPTAVTAIRRILDSAEPGIGLPVVVRMRGSIHFLGRAQSQAEAEMLGIASSLRCARAARGRLLGETRQFFVLH